MKVTTQMMTAQGAHLKYGKGELTHGKHDNADGKTS